MRETNPIISELTQTRAGEVVVLGAPWDQGSSFLRGTALGPRRIREALFSQARSLVTEAGEDLAEKTSFRVLGDLDLDKPETVAGILEEAAEGVLSRGGRPPTLGGDHSITTGLVRAVARHHPGLVLVQIDAHPDLYEDYDGDRRSHACPMTRILEEGLVERLVQIGIRAMNPPQRAVADRFGVEVLEMRTWDDSASAIRGIVGPVYLSLDLDGLDPAYAPGVSHPEPGGLSTRQVLEILQYLPGPIVAADIVELNPVRDLHDLTAVVASKLLKEMASRMLHEDSR